MNRGIKPCCNHKILLASVFLVASAFPLVGQERAVAPFQQTPHQAPHQAPHQVPPAWQQPVPEGHGGVPSLMGRTPGEANAILGGQHLSGSEMGSVPSTKYRPGTVSRQDPPPNAPVPHDRIVRYWLAEESLVRVPDIVGFEPERMFTALSGARLVGRLADKKMSNYRFGKITRQKPPAGTMVKSGSTVIVWVSDSRPNPPPTRPPNGSGGHSTWDLKSFLLGIILAFIAAKLLRRRQKPQSPFELRPVLDPGAQVLVKVGPLVKAE